MLVSNLELVPGRHIVAHYGIRASTMMAGRIVSCCNPSPLTKKSIRAD
jgi:hypothetical protein